MKLASWNINGLRAVHRKGNLKEFIDACDADVYFFQEIKSSALQAKDVAAAFSSFSQHYHPAQKPGYAGTAVWYKGEGTPSVGMPKWDDHEGRVIQLEYKNLVLLGVYFPNGGKSPEAWDEKLVFYDHFLGYMNKLRASGKQVLWSGDINCAHNEIDIARPKDNDGKIGFHPKERAWLDRVVEEGWVDVFRFLHPEEIVYSYWHLISGARKRNVGWRIDYWFVDKGFMPKVVDITYMTDQMGSDHCPVILQIKDE